MVESYLLVVVAVDIVVVMSLLHVLMRVELQMNLFLMDWRRMWGLRVIDRVAVSSPGRCASVDKALCAGVHVEVRYRMVILVQVSVVVVDDARPRDVV